MGGIHIFSRNEEIPGHLIFPYTPQEIHWNQSISLITSIVSGGEIALNASWMHVRGSPSMLMLMV